MDCKHKVHPEKSRIIRIIHFKIFIVTNKLIFTLNKMDLISIKATVLILFKTMNIEL